MPSHIMTVSLTSAPRAFKPDFKQVIKTHENENQEKLQWDYLWSKLLLCFLDKDNESDLVYLGIV